MNVVAKKYHTHVIVKASYCVIAINSFRKIFPSYLRDRESMSGRRVSFHQQMFGRLDNLVNAEEEVSKLRLESRCRGATVSLTANG